MAAKKSRIQELREQAKKLLDQAKAEEVKAYGELGKAALDFLSGKITHEELKNKATDSGLIDN